MATRRLAIHFRGKLPIGWKPHKSQSWAVAAPWSLAIAGKGSRDSGIPEIIGRGERIRTSDSCVPNAVLYQAELHPDVIRECPHNHDLRDTEKVDNSIRAFL